MDPELVRRLEADGSAAVGLPADLWERVEAEVQRPTWRDPWITASTRARAGIAVAGSALVGALLVGVQGVRPDLDAAGWLTFAAVSAPLVAVAGIAGLLSLRSRGSIVLATDRLAVALVLAVAAACALPFPGMHGVPMDAHLHCLQATALATTGIAALFALLERDARPAPARVALGAVAGGAWAYVAQAVFCPGADVVHLFVGHGLSALVVACLGAALAALARR